MNRTRSFTMLCVVLLAGSLSACSGTASTQVEGDESSRPTDSNAAPAETAPTCRLDPDTGLFSDCDPGAPNSPSPSEKAAETARQSAPGLIVLRDFGKLSSEATLELVSIPAGEASYSAAFALDPSLTVGSPTFGTVSTDLSYLVARKLQDDGTQHGGFIDQSGSFYDASGPLAQAGSFAGGLTTDRVAFVEGRLYFNLRSTGDNSTDAVYSITIDQVTSNEATASDYRKESVASPVYADALPVFAPDGTVTKQTNGCVKAYGKWAFNPDGFVGGSSYVAVHDETILKYPLRSSCYKSFINGERILPSSDQAVTQLVMSPDTSKVAFTAQQGQQLTWYTVSADGGSPSVVGTVGGASGKLVGWR